MPGPVAAGTPGQLTPSPAAAPTPNMGSQAAAAQQVKQALLMLETALPQAPEKRWLRPLSGAKAGHIVLPTRIVRVEVVAPVCGLAAGVEAAVRDNCQPWHSP